MCYIPPPGDQRGGQRGDAPKPVAELIKGGLYISLPLSLSLYIYIYIHIYIHTHRQIYSNTH